MTRKNRWCKFAERFCSGASRIPQSQILTERKKQFCKRKVILHGEKLREEQRKKREVKKEEKRSSKTQQQGKKRALQEKGKREDKEASHFLLSFTFRKIHDFLSYENMRMKLSHKLDSQSEL